MKAQMVRGLGIKFHCVQSLREVWFWRCQNDPHFKVPWYSPIKWQMVTVFLDARQQLLALWPSPRTEELRSNLTDEQLDCKFENFLQGINGFGRTERVNSLECLWTPKFTNWHWRYGRYGPQRPLLTTFFPGQQASSHILVGVFYLDNAYLFEWVNLKSSAVLYCACPFTQTCSAVDYQMQVYSSLWGLVAILPIQSLSVAPLGACHESRIRQWWKNRSGSVGEPYNLKHLSDLVSSRNNWIYCCWLVYPKSWLLT